MKRYFLLLMLATAISAGAQAQTQVTRVRPGAAATAPKMADEHSIVKDSSGKVLPYEEWHNLLITGNYGLRSIGADPTYTLFKLSPKQKEERDKRVAALREEQAPAKPAVSDPLAPIVTPSSAPAPTQEEMMAQLPPPRESGFFVNGEKPKSFRAYDIAGKRVELKDLAGKVVVLNFWFIGCPPCRAEIPELNKIAAQYADDHNVVFVAIGLDPRADIKDFIKQMPYNYRLIANGSESAGIYGVHLYPTNVVIDKGGIVRFNASGYGSNTPYWIKKTISESLAAN